MNKFIPWGAILTCLCLVACTEKPATPEPTTTSKLQAKTVAAKIPAKTNHVQLSADTKHHSDIEGTYYVQNRVIASGGAISGAIMGS